ncbi:GCN5-related N-acetyltransferase [Shewanella sediminis HAW-EB3]|uniref:GCN5-related N-acetyltransferase n=1 Tax=Shewanella sediminis (strain HAW-EB3) TaxID=425104 RepID=A8FQS1_SHESH|nr:GNAT family N-acetyltransferase [Shewanella sediminis]ABV35194.1 GCN5-related N-acetyltransferase [Shewanella sediminis HAW-EB3]
MILIRKAVEGDAQAIYDLRSRAILEECAGFYSAEQLSLWTKGGVSESLMTDIVNSFYVSEIDGQVIGSGKLTIETGMLDAIFVEPEFFGRGAARLMVSFLENLALESGLSSIKLESTLNAAPFYRRCGFVGDEISTYHSPRGISLDCVPMLKSLEKREQGDASQQ